MASPQDVSSGRAWFRPVTKALSTPAAACVVPQEGQAALYSNNIAQTLSEQTLNCFSDGRLRSACAGKRKRRHWDYEYRSELPLFL